MCLNRRAFTTKVVCEIRCTLSFASAWLLVGGFALLHKGRNADAHAGRRMDSQPLIAQAAAGISDRTPKRPVCTHARIAACMSVIAQDAEMRFYVMFR
jgi:hypothetical protein